MARRSPHEHLKGEIFDWFGAGESQAEVRARYPKIPKATVRDWHKAWKESCSNPHDSTRNPHDYMQPPKQVTVEVVPDGHQLTIPGAIIPARTKRVIAALPTKHSDYWRVRREAVSIATDPDVAKYVKVQAIAATCKLLELERDLPKHILEQQTETTIGDSRASIQGQPLNEIAKEYREAMG